MQKISPMVIETEVYKDHTIQILYEESPDNPRDWDNITTMHCFHSKYELGDTKHTGETYRNWDVLEDKIRKEKDPFLLLPLYLYSHGGIEIATAPRGHWDTTKIGFIYASLKSIKDKVDMWKSESKDFYKDPLVAAMTMFQHEINIYNQYLAGDVYGFRILFPCKCCGSLNEIEEGSVWGYYKTDDAIKYAKSVIDNIQ